MADEHPQRQVEHERTYEVPDGAVVPAGGGDGEGALRVGEVRTVLLRAGYLDTERLDLRRRGVTLRRRTGGDDEGWHLKVPAGTDRRLEVRLPLGDGGDDEVPQALLDEVRALVRDRPLRLVATLTTERTEHHLLDADGAPLAVVCDDRVAAGVEGGAATSWREWEVELAPGRDETDLDALERAVLAAGAGRSDQPSKLGRVLARPQPPDPPDEGSAGALLHARLTGLVAELRRRDADVRAGRDEGVHRMRVAARRLRS
ncbi:CYTH domain-containing protein, partial [Angustibacter speluncae]